MGDHADNAIDYLIFGRQQRSRCKGRSKRKVVGATRMDPVERERMIKSAQKNDLQKLAKLAKARGLLPKR